MDWETKDDQTSLVLTPIEREYILTGSTAKYSGKDTERLPNNIEDKASGLDLRFQELIDDLTLFYSHGILDEIDWSKKVKNTRHEHLPESALLHLGEDEDTDTSLWAKLGELYSIERRATKLKEIPPSGMHPPHHLPVNFGLEIGCILHLLLEANNASEEYQDILWGLVLSELENISDDPSEQKQHLKDLFGEFEKRHTNRTEQREEALMGQERIREWHNQAHQSAREVLLEAGFEASEAQKSTLIELSGITQLEKVDIKQIQHSTLESHEIKFRLGSYLETIIKHDGEAITENEPRWIPAINLVKILLKARYASEDYAQKVLEAEIPSGYEPLLVEEDEIEDWSEPVNINEIKDQFDRAQRHVTTALRRLAKEYNRPDWPTYPVTNGIKDDKWQLTGYGRVVSLYLFRSGKETRWVYATLFPELDVYYESKPKRNALRDALVEILVHESGDTGENTEETPEAADLTWSELAQEITRRVN